MIIYILRYFYKDEYILQLVYKIHKYHAHFSDSNQKLMSILFDLNLKTNLYHLLMIEVYLYQQ